MSLGDRPCDCIYRSGDVGCRAAMVAKRAIRERTQPAMARPNA
jgi:hypothetical protein